MRIQLVRHATLLLNYGGRRLAVDPMFAAPGTMDAAANAANDLPNPRVPLPLESERVTSAEAVLLTHLHRDHFDEAAATLLPKHLPLFCQPRDAEALERLRFHNVRPVEDGITWCDLRIERVGGQHGRGEMAERMGPVSGYVLYTVGDATLYIAGDTVWCPEVAGALRQFCPDVVIVNAGAAQFNTGGPITMDADDVVKLARAIPTAFVVAVHMEAWNHCGLTRADLRARMDDERLSGRVFIPTDGETLTF